MSISNHAETVHAMTYGPDEPRPDWVVVLEWGPYGYRVVVIGTDGKRYIQNTEDWGPGADYDAALDLFHETAQWSRSEDFDPTDIANFTPED